MKLAKYTKFREERFGGVLFETSAEKVFALNRAAAAVLREIAAGADEVTIIARMKERFNDRNGTMARDVAVLVADLRQKGLIED